VGWYEIDDDHRVPSPVLAFISAFLGFLRFTDSFFFFSKEKEMGQWVASNWID
jgi:hypothetical protein